MSSPKPSIYGLLAEFGDPNDILAAAHRAYEAGYRQMEAYSPFPVEDLSEALGYHRRTRLPLIVLLGGLTGCIGGFLMQYYLSVFDFPINVGGKPLDSWPNFIPITFECTVLIAAFSAVLGMLALNGLPQPYHPAFNAPNFALASRDHFFLMIEAADPKFDRASTADFLQSLGAREVTDVEP